jgi:hypothetical protein
VATGSNIAGSFLNLQAGTGTGNASVSSATISLQTPDTGSSGSSLQTQVTRMSVSSSGINIGTSSDGTTFKRLEHGTAVLVGGTVTVADTTITANSRIILTSQVGGGTPGWLRVSARSAGVSFTITSSSGTDTSTVGYVIIEP